MRGSDQKLRRPGESLPVIPINQEKELPSPPVNENEKEHPPLPSPDKDWQNVATLVNEWERFAATMSDYLRTLAGSAERITHALPPPAGEPERLVRISELTEAVALLNEGSFPHSFLRLELLRLATRRFDPVAHARIEAECGARRSAESGDLRC